MSLIDTIALGQMAGSLQLAAIGPCSLIFNFAFYSFTALSVATVSLIAERLRKAKENNNNNNNNGSSGATAEDALSTALFLGASGGILIAAVILVWGPRLLALTGCDPSLLSTSWSYLRIRVLAAPAAVITQIAQSGLLAQRDSRTPFKIVILSILLSFVGDVWLIGGRGMGVAGAAWSTLAAQYLSATLLLRALTGSAVVPRFNTIPSKGEISALMATASTLGVFYLAKTTSYLFLQATATRLPAMLLAAHQPVWQLWGLTSFTNTPLEQAALTFIPGILTLRGRQEFMTLLLFLGAVNGVVCAIVAHGLPALQPALLTADAALWPHMQSIWLPGSLALLACGVDVSATGVLLACKDGAYVARSMIMSGSALIAFLRWRSSGGGGGGGGLGGVWWSLTVFFCVRVAQSLPRVVLVHMRRRGGNSSNGSSSGTAMEATAAVPSTSSPSEVSIEEEEALIVEDFNVRAT